MIFLELSVLGVFSRLSRLLRVFFVVQSNIFYWLDEEFSFMIISFSREGKEKPTKLQGTFGIVFFVGFVYISV